MMVHQYGCGKAAVQLAAITCHFIFAKHANLKIKVNIRQLLLLLLPLVGAVGAIALPSLTEDLASVVKFCQHSYRLKEANVGGQV